jgi:hypothetical protein
MIENFKISLWDLFTFFVTGVVIYFCLSYLGFDFELQFSKSEFLNNIIVIIIFYVVGLIFEPIANYIFKFLKKKVYKSCNDDVKNNEDYKSKYYEEVKELIDKDYPNLSKSNNIYFQLAKSVLLQSNVSNSFMEFLAKYGLLRNLSILSLFMFILHFFYKYDDFKNQLLIYFLLPIFFAIIHYKLFRRAQVFYLYVGQEVFRNYIVLKHRKEV